MYNTPVGDIQDWYRGVDHRGHEYLVTIWGHGEVWVQMRDTPADSFSRPVVCRCISPVNRIIETDPS